MTDNAVLSRYTLGYDDARNRIALGETDAAGTTEETRFQFGRHNQLSWVEYPTYRVDYGNDGPLEARTWETATGSQSYHREYCYGNLGRLSQVKDSRGKQIDFQYDLNGNQTRKTLTEGTTVATTEMFFDIRDTLREVRRDATQLERMEYDHAGRRVRELTVGGEERTTYDGSEPLLDVDGANELVGRYAYGDGRMLEREAREGALWRAYGFGWNHLGSTSETVGADDLMIRETYRYDAWGQPKIQNPTNLAKGRTFTGQKYDAATGLYAMGNGTRYYDADLGMFTQEDPVYGEAGDPQTLSPYVYARNNPMWFQDPDGTFVVGTGLSEDQKKAIREGGGKTGVSTQGQEYVLAQLNYQNGKTDVTKLGEFILNSKQGEAYIVLEEGEDRKQVLEGLVKLGISFSPQNIYQGELVNFQSVVQSRVDEPVDEVIQIEAEHPGGAMLKADARSVMDAVKEGETLEEARENRRKERAQNGHIMVQTIGDAGDGSNAAIVGAMLYNQVSNGESPNAEDVNALARNAATRSIFKSAQFIYGYSPPHTPSSPQFNLLRPQLSSSFEGGNKGGKGVTFYNPSGENRNCAACTAAVIRTKLTGTKTTADDIQSQFPVSGNLSSVPSTVQYIANATGTTPREVSSFKGGPGHYAFLFFGRLNPETRHIENHVVYVRVTNSLRYIWDAQNHKKPIILNRIGGPVFNKFPDTVNENIKPRVFKFEP